MNKLNLLGKLLKQIKSSNNPRLPELFLFLTREIYMPKV